MFSLAEVAKKLGVSERTARNYAHALAEVLHPEVQGRTRLYPPGDLPLFQTAARLYGKGATTPAVLDALRARFPEAATAESTESTATAETLAIVGYGNPGGNGGNASALAVAEQFSEAIKRLTAVLERMEQRDAERADLTGKVDALAGVVAALAKHAKKGKGKRVGGETKTRLKALQHAAEAVRTAPTPAPVSLSRFREREAKRGRGRR